MTGFFAAGGRPLAAAGFAAFARVAFAGDAPDDFLSVGLDGVFGGFLDVFLRVFLDIRLPFVAFGGSINGYLQGVVPVSPNRANRWANLMASEYGYKDSTYHLTLVNRARWAE